MLHFIACRHLAHRIRPGSYPSNMRQYGAGPLRCAMQWCVFLLHCINDHNNQRFAPGEWMARNLLFRK